MKGLIDTTLREGVQTAGISFSKEDKEEIVAALTVVGIEEIEVGIVNAYDQELAGIIRQCRQISPRTKISLWSLCRKTDIALAAQLSPDVLSLSLPVSDIHLKYKLQKNRSWVADTLVESVSYAKKQGFKQISLGLEDATRADLNFIMEIGRLAEKLGVFRLRLADTVGIASPRQIQTMLHAFNHSTLELGVHCHNDFGMATANCIAALEAGAAWADVTILGLGERTGTARLEEVTAYLALQNGKSYTIAAIPALSRKVSALTNKPIPDNQPITGQAIFTCETGLHLQGLEQSPHTYEPFPPELVGARRHLIYGDKVGRRGRLMR